MKRFRFIVRLNDGSGECRPVDWPLKYPYWCSGYDSDMNAINIAYEESWKAIKKHWPEAVKDSEDEVDEILFTSRFREPEWWKNDGTIKTRTI